MNNQNYKLMLCIAPHNEGEALCAIANANGATGGTLLLGRGTAQNAILQLLGLGDTSKDIALIVVEAEKAEVLTAKLCEEEATRKSHFGVLISVNVKDFYRAGSACLRKEDSVMGKAATGVELIKVIVNKGYADDAMAAARKAGATGGTVINARGTAKPDDAEFFGVQLVPEKEILLTIVEKDKVEAVYEAICSLPCLAEKGSGIVCRIPVDSFNLLGK